MKDCRGREINYMRISVTDRCNLRCTYCMPNGIRSLPMSEILTYEEIERVCRQAVLLGIDRFKITGGEPLVRLGVPTLIKMICEIPGVRQVTMTTNAVLLEEYLPQLIDAGLDAVNISLDTLDPQKYLKITGADKLDKVLSALDAAVAGGIPTKVNTVLQQGFNDTEWEDLLLLAKDLPIDIRFIERMPIGYASSLQAVSNTGLLLMIQEKYADVVPDDTCRGNGPARYCRIPGFLGRVGLISPLSDPFCGSCNRIRLTASGDLRPCLGWDRSLNLREALRGGTDEDVRALIEEAVKEKPAGHDFGAGRPDTGMSEIGG